MRFPKKHTTHGNTNRTSDKVGRNTIKEERPHRPGKEVAHTSGGRPNNNNRYKAIELEAKKRISPNPHANPREPGPSLQVLHIHKTGKQTEDPPSQGLNDPIYPTNPLIANKGVGTSTHKNPV